MVKPVFFVPSGLPIISYNFASTLYWIFSLTLLSLKPGLIPLFDFSGFLQYDIAWIVRVYSWKKIHDIYECPLSAEAKVGRWLVHSVLLQVAAEWNLREDLKNQLNFYLFLCHFLYFLSVSTPKILLSVHTHTWWPTFFMCYYK